MYNTFTTNCCYSRYSLLYRKSTSNERTFTTIRRLDNNQRKDEIARLIAGSNITEKTMEHATEIIELAKRSL